MKYLTFYLTVFCSLITPVLFAQTSQQIEADLVKSIKKIGYYAEKHDDEHLGDASDLFAAKLKNYATKFPETISYPFNQLKQEPLTILSSADGLFRIYSWDNESGGTMRF